MATTESVIMVRLDTEDVKQLRELVDRMDAAAEKMRAAVAALAERDAQEALRIEREARTSRARSPRIRGGR